MSSISLFKLVIKMLNGRRINPIAELCPTIITRTLSLNGHQSIKHSVQHLASQLQITKCCYCAVHISPSCPQRSHRGSPKHLAEKSRYTVSTAFSWWTGLVTLSPPDKNTMRFSLLCLIHLRPDGNWFMTFYDFITFPVSPWHHSSPSLELQKATKVLRTRSLNPPPPPVYQVTWFPRWLKWRM